MARQAANNQTNASAEGLPGRATMENTKKILGNHDFSEKAASRTLRMILNKFNDDGFSENERGSLPQDIASV
jgi:hypothetical protein